MELELEESRGHDRRQLTPGIWCPGEKQCSPCILRGGILGRGSEPAYSKERGALGAGPGQFCASGEVESMTEKMERVVREGSGNRGHREMHRLPGGHLGTWADAVPWEGGCRRDCARRLEQKP